jgi:hypothetical protein
MKPHIQFCCQAFHNPQHPTNLHQTKKSTINLNHHGSPFEISRKNEKMMIIIHQLQIKMKGNFAWFITRI